MVNEPIEQNPALKEGTENNPAPKQEGEQQEETYSKAQLTEMLQKEIGKVTAKHSKKMDAIMAELEAEKRKSLPDPEKTKADIEDRDKKIVAAEAKIASYEAREKKRAALDAAKLNLPADITVQDLLDMMPGNTDEEIETYIEKFKKMFPASKGLGTSTTLGGSPKAPPAIDEQIAQAHAEALKTGNWQLYTQLTLQKQKTTP